MTIDSKTINRVIKIRALVESPFAKDGLTPAELEAANLAARGCSVMEIARELDITLPAAGQRLHNARFKLGLDKAEMVREFVRRLEEALQ